MTQPKRITITGGAGQIAYSLLFRLASGELFGPNQPVELNILELPVSLEALEGVIMELNDCAFPLLHKVTAHTDPVAAFDGVDVAFLVGAKPRGPGMERQDLLGENGKIFVTQGKALNKGAHKDSKILIVGNPCNTNCLVAMHNAPDIPRENFFAMTRLDQNRAAYQLADKAGGLSRDVTDMIIWGNHSATQVPDFTLAKIAGKSATDVIPDRSYLEGAFLKTVQQRGAEIIKARGKSSAASAANAAIDTVRSLHARDGHIHSVGKISDHNPYGVSDGLIYSFPVRGCGEIVGGLTIDPFIEKMMKETEKELIMERDMVKDLL